MQNELFQRGSEKNIVISFSSVLPFVNGCVHSAAELKGSISDVCAFLMPVIYLYVNYVSVIEL